MIAIIVWLFRKPADVGIVEELIVGGKSLSVFLHISVKASTLLLPVDTRTVPPLPLRFCYPEPCEPYAVSPLTCDVAREVSRHSGQVGRRMDVPPVVQENEPFLDRSWDSFPLDYKIASYTRQEYYNR